MHPHLAWLRPLRQAIRVALARLHHSLVRITVRVRETVVEAVAQAAAEVVRQASAPLLPVADQFLDRKPVQRPRGSALIWDDDDSHRREDDYADYQPSPDDWDDYEPQEEPEEVPAAPSRLPAALASGCRVAAWLLDHGGYRPLTTALGAGLLTALACSGGPLIAASVGLVGSLATCLSLSAG